MKEEEGFQQTGLVGKIRTEAAAQGRVDIPERKGQRKELGMIIIANVLELLDLPWEGDGLKV